MCLGHLVHIGKRRRKEKNKGGKRGDSNNREQVSSEISDLSSNKLGVAQYSRRLLHDGSIDNHLWGGGLASKGWGGCVLQ